MNQFDVGYDYVKIHFESFGDESLIAPDPSCIIEQPSNAAINPTNTDILTRQSTHYAGSLTYSFTLNSSSSYYFRYGCYTNSYSDAFLFKTTGSQPPSIIVDGLN